MAASGGLLEFAMDKSLKHRVVKGDVEDVNGEEVERTARNQQFVEFVRAGVVGLGFVMGVVGIWGDGA